MGNRHDFARRARRGYFLFRQPELLVSRHKDSRRRETTCVDTLTAGLKDDTWRGRCALRYNSIQERRGGVPITGCNAQVGKNAHRGPLGARMGKGRAVGAEDHTGNPKRRGGSQDTAEVKGRANVRKIDNDRQERPVSLRALARHAIFAVPSLQPYIPHRRGGQDTPAPLPHPAVVVWFAKDRRARTGDRSVRIKQVSQPAKQRHAPLSVGFTGELQLKRLNNRAEVLHVFHRGGITGYDEIMEVQSVANISVQTARRQGCDARHREKRAVNRFIRRRNGHRRSIRVGDKLLQDIRRRASRDGGQPLIFNSIVGSRAQILMGNVKVPKTNR